MDYYDLNVKGQTTNLLKDNTIENIHYLVLGDNLDMMPKAQSIKKSVNWN